MIKKKFSKGFSLVELLAVVIILGVLSTISIVSYSRYVNKAREEVDIENKNLIINAAKAYLQANKNSAPKSIGSSVEIDLNTLKSNNYLTDDVIDSKGNSCMKYSYVYVYKYNYSRYSYLAHLNCGDSKSDLEIPYPESPVITFLNTDSLNDVSFSLSLNGGKDADGSNIKIGGYSYVVYSKKSKESNFTEIYNSGSITDNSKTSVTVGPVNLNKYIDVTASTTFKVDVVVYNIYGGASQTSKEVVVADENLPICGTISGQAKNDNDWLNKMDVTNGNRRAISVLCSDTNGSGCVKDTYTSIWPKKSGNNYTSVSDAKITIKDNSGKSRDCNVKVNVDVVSPTIKVTVKQYKGKDTNDKIIVGSVVMNSKEAKDGDNLTIEATDYNDAVNGWLNRQHYYYSDTSTYGVAYVFELEDDIALDGYTWKYNDTGKNSSASNSDVETFKNPNASKVAISTTNNKKTIVVSLTGQGRRYAEFTAYDKAGNSTTVKIYANIDRTAPTAPTLTMTHTYKKNNAQGSKATIYDNNTWINTNVYMTDSRRTPFTGPQSTDSLSGVQKYQISTDNKSWNDYDYDYTKMLYNITVEGTSKRYLRAVDNAGNISAVTEKIIKRDDTGPTISCNFSSSGITDIVINDSGSGVNNSTKEYVSSMSSTIDGIQATWGGTDSYKKPGTNCGKTYYGYVKASDNAGNETIQKCTGSYTRPSCCSESNPTGCDWVTACRGDGITAIFTTTSHDTWAGTVSHNDRLYILGTDSSGTMTKVYANSGNFYAAAPDNHIVWIFSRCLGPKNVICPYRKCPG